MTTRREFLTALAATAALPLLPAAGEAQPATRVLTRVVAFGEITTWEQGTPWLFIGSEGENICAATGPTPLFIPVFNIVSVSNNIPLSQEKVLAAAADRARVLVERGKEAFPGKDLTLRAVVTDVLRLQKTAILFWPDREERIESPLDTVAVKLGLAVAPSANNDWTQNEPVRFAENPVVQAIRAALA